MHDIGVYFVLIFVFLNVLLFLNVVIAMMADTYAMMTSMRKGIYNFNIIKSASVYKLDKYYGGIILLNTPLSVFSFLLLPYYALVKDKKRLETFNSRVYCSVYAIFVVFLAAIFLALNLIMMPFAFIKTCVHKINLARMGIIPWCQPLVYFISGLPLLLISQVTDLWAFLKASACPDKKY